MSRRKKGRQVSGWLVVDKPAGIGSTDVVARVRRALGAQKAGHAGTLDPAATGVLAVALGEATKAVPWLESALKAYRFSVRWGATTLSDDAEGVVLVTSDARPAAEAILAALPAFRGDILQVPPKVSAVHVDGARAHDLVREGVEFDLVARPLWVERLELVEASRDEAILEMVCGKGGYVRAIARDLGAALGVPAHVGWLRRLWSGPFRAEDGIGMGDLDRLAEAGELDGRLRPIQMALVGVGEVQVTEAGAERLAHGNPGEIAGPCPEEGTEVWAGREGRAIAVGVVHQGMLAPRRVFNPDGP